MFHITNKTAFYIEWYACVIIMRNWILIITITFFTFFPFIFNSRRKVLFQRIDDYHSKQINPTLYDMQQFILTKLKKSLSPDTLLKHLIDSVLYRLTKGESID